MKLKTIFFTLSFLLSTPIMAQSLYDGMYSAEWEAERDARTGMNQPKLTEHYTKREKFWNQSFLRDRHLPQQKGINISVNTTPSSTTKQTSRTSQSRKTTSSNRSFGSHNNNKYPQRQPGPSAAEIAAKNRAADNKAKAQFVDNYNRSQQRNRVEAMQRDHYMATEGARQLDENVRAENYMTRPVDEKFSMSGDALADKLEGGKEKEKGLIITFANTSEIESKRSSGTFKQLPDGQIMQGGFISQSSPQEASVFELQMFRNGNFDETEAEEWTLQLNLDQGTILRPDINKKLKPYQKNTEYKIILSHNDVNPDSLTIGIMEGKGLIALSQNRFVFLNDSTLTTYHWNIPFQDASELVGCGRHAIIKDGVNLIDVHGQNAQPDTLLAMDVDFGHIHPYTENAFLISCAYEDLSSVMQVSLMDNSYTEFARTPYNIQRIAASAKFAQVMALVEDYRVVCINKGRPISYYISDEPISDIAYCQAGLLISSPTQVLLIETTHKKPCILQFCDRGMSRLWVDRNHVYGQTLDNDIVEIIHNK